MDRSMYSAEDFAADESYLRYYYKTNAGDVVFWEEWISHHPEKLDVIVAADQLIALLSLHLPEEAFQKESERLMQAIVRSDETGKTEEPEKPEPDFHASKTRRRFVPLALLTIISAAAILLVVLYFPKPVTTDNLPDAAKSGWLTRTNQSGQPLELRLEDSTLVRLEPGASLSTPAQFQKDKREVSLKGNAFFHVSKNAARPFFIFSGQIVTHVIGTSFTIKQDLAGHKMEVSVLTGKVEVYEQQTLAVADKLPGRQSNGVILTPNQKVIYQEEQRRFETSLAENPLPLPAEKMRSGSGVNALVSLDSSYTDVRISALLTGLSERYGISIAVENENIYNCHFTGDLSGMGLYEKLDVLCKAVGASYELKGIQIMIRGRGCAVQAP